MLSLKPNFFSRFWRLLKLEISIHLRILSALVSKGNESFRNYQKPDEFLIN